MPDARRRLPSLDTLIRSAPGQRASARFGRPVVRQALRQVLEEAREGAGGGLTPPEDSILMARAVGLAARLAFGLSPVINATGVVLHTGLGRAPLPDAAVRAVRKMAGGYADLEIDRETGARGRRTTRAEFLLTALTGAEDALVVNNNAAALLLALAGLARRKDVLVSRGELIEIGGEFRLPEIMAASGARLVEVGTTNRTRVQDYRAAVSSKTGLILKVHPSNYRVVGFAQSPSVSSLAAVARKADVPLLHDVGSGLLDRYREVPAEEPAATEALAEGADLVCFSGDKLLGGPQAGILLGRSELIDRLRRHPVARAVRVDKMTVAALEAVLRLYAEGHRDQVPAWRLLSERPAALRTRARTLAGSLPAASVETGEAVAGGGSIPGYGIPSV
ncbi:MAG TPA: L-seryl-tRNA(Sec) selenium transferase, partial [Actinomycetota bacterium]|nr:L-seryl-tRNA(Sec) selenium transferase [Actinomycetota bacterium]